MDDAQSTLDAFRLAGRGHLQAAECVIAGVKPLMAALTVGSAAYLAHLAMECAIKARILHRVGCASVSELQRKSPKAYQSLFRSRHGHDLVRLAQELRLENFVKMQGKSWLDDACWKRMTHDSRPYGLRYGSERIDLAEATEDLNRSKQLAEILLDGLRAPAKRKRNGS